VDRLTIFIGLDDTDNPESRGTGHLARAIADRLSIEFEILGVTRHQLLVDSRVPCTKNNSSSAIVLRADHNTSLEPIFGRVYDSMAADLQSGSDPGLCIAQTVPAAVIAFGRRAQSRLVTQLEARALAARLDLLLVGLAGDQGGVIGALAAVGLAASEEDGRYVMVGRVRDLAGLQPISALLAAGIASVQTVAGEPVVDGLVQTDKLRPARRGGRPIAFVEWRQDCWHPLRLD
jgi:tRNA(Ile2) C34 agmatinyltransferase TiaS